MKNIYILTITLASLCSLTKAQVGVNTENPHPKSLLDIKQTDPTMGVLFSEATNYTEFPKYNPSADDLYDDDPGLFGALIFNQDDKQFYKYNGYAWLPAPQYGGFNNPNISRIKSSAGTTANCTGGLGFSICSNGGNYIAFRDQALPNYNQLLLDNIDISTPDNNVLSISEQGLYSISFSLKLNTNISLAFGSIYAYMDLQYRDPANGGWYTIKQERLPLSVLFLNFWSEYNLSTTAISYLPENAQIRGTFFVGMDDTTLGGGTYFYTNATGYRDTFLVVEQIHKY